jgi:hypothetical protein
MDLVDCIVEADSSEQVRNLLESVEEKEGYVLLVSQFQPFGLDQMMAEVDGAVGSG